MKKQNRAFFFRLPENLLRDFQKYCKENGSCASVELRRFMIEKTQKGGSDGKENRPT